MNYLWLEYFIQVAEEGNMSKAAEKNHVSLPCVSQIIQKLEREVGVPLFERQKNRIFITANGKKFLQYAKSTLSQKNELIRIFQDADGVCGDIRLCTSSLRAAYLAPSLWLLHLKYPQIQIFLNDKDMSYTQRIETLRSGESDFIIAEENKLNPDLYEIPLCKEHYYVVLKKDSELFRRHFSDGVLPEKISLRELAQETLLLSRSGTKIRMRIDAIFSDIGVSPAATFECSSMLVKESLAERGLGYMVKNYPQGFSDYLKRPDLCYIPIDHPQASLQLALTMRKGFYVTEAHRLFIKTIKDCLADTTQRDKSATDTSL